MHDDRRSLTETSSAPSRGARLVGAIVDSLVPILANLALVPWLAMIAMNDALLIGIYSPELGGDPVILAGARWMLRPVVLLLGGHALIQCAVAVTRSTTLGGVVRGLRVATPKGSEARGRTLARVSIGSVLALAPAALLWDRISASPIARYGAHSLASFHLTLASFGALVAVRLAFDALALALARTPNGRTLLDRVTCTRILRRDDPRADRMLARSTV